MLEAEIAKEFCDNDAENLEKIEKNNVHREQIVKAYSLENWGALPNFAGNYINFGYWKNILNKENFEEISLGQRIMRIPAKPATDSS